MTLLISNIPCWLIPILVGVICAILGYLLGRLFGGNSNETNNEGDLDVYKNRISQLESDLETCRATKRTTNLTEKPSNVSSVSSFAAGGGASATNFDSAAAKLAFGKKIKQDDLTVVEGIGPKIRELFHNHDVKTWAGLADCSVEKCETVLKSGGKRFELHKPGTWPEQSKMAALGQWQKLKDWQDTLDGGR